MACRSGASGLGGGRAGGGGGGGGGGRRAPGGGDEEERRRIRSVAAKKRTSRRWANWGRTPPSPTVARPLRRQRAHGTDASSRAGAPPSSLMRGE
jgi:hypothetical protein